MKTPSFRRHDLRCLTTTAGMTFFLRSGFPFFTVAITMSPTQAEGSLLRRPLIPFTEMMYKFLAPVLSAQFMVAATGRPSDIRNLLPAEPPRPVDKKWAPARTYLDKRNKHVCSKLNQYYSNARQPHNKCEITWSEKCNYLNASFKSNTSTLQARKRTGKPQGTIAHIYWI